MNKIRRAKLKNAIKLIDEARDIIDDVRDDESDSLSNIPESFENTERYEQMEFAIDSMEDASENCSVAINCLEGL